MDFSITSLFVVPVGNTLPTSGSTENLTSGQFGIYKDKLRAVATAGNVSSANYIQIAQGRPGTGLGTKLSDRIKASKVKRWEKIVGHATAANEIWEVGNLAATKGDDLVISWRVHSTLLEARHPNGLTQSVAIPGDCVQCGDAPCEVVTNEAVIDAFFEQYNLILSQQIPAGNALRLNSYITAEKIGTGDTAVIRFTSKPVETIPTYAPDIATRNVSKDRVWFRVFSYKQPETTADFYNEDDCSKVGTATLVQRSSFVSGTSEEIKQMEVDYYSYQATQKPLYRNGQFNQQFSSYVTDGTVYDLYYVQFDEVSPDSQTFADSSVKIDETAIVAVSQADAAGVEAILVAYLGAVTDISGADQTTTTTTSTSSTTTTSTTQAIP